MTPAPWEPFGLRGSVAADWRAARRGGRSRAGATLRVLVLLVRDVLAV